MKKLKCHCGEVEAEINVPDNLEKVLKCNCSICKRKEQLCLWLRMKTLNH